MIFAIQFIPDTSVNNCDPNPCVNGRCLNLPTTMTFYCVCDAGYSGRFCDEVEAIGKYSIGNVLEGSEPQGL